MPSLSDRSHVDTCSWTHCNVMGLRANMVSVKKCPRARNSRGWYCEHHARFAGWTG